MRFSVLVDEPDRCTRSNIELRRIEGVIVDIYRFWPLGSGTVVWVGAVVSAVWVGVLCSAVWVGVLGSTGFFFGGQVVEFCTSVVCPVAGGSLWAIAMVANTSTATAESGITYIVSRFTRPPSGILTSALLALLLLIGSRPLGTSPLQVPKGRSDA